MRYYAVYGYSGQTGFINSDNYSYASYFVLHHPYLDKNVFIYNMEIIEQDSVSGTFTFTVPLSHPNIGSFDCGLIVEVRKFDAEPESVNDAHAGGVPVWIGRLINLESDMYGNLNCTCEGPLGFLKDGFISKENSSPEPATMTIAEYLKKVVYTILDGNQGQVTRTLRRARPPGIVFTDVNIQVSPESSFSYLSAPIGTIEEFEPNSMGLYAYSPSTPTNIFDFIKKYFETGLSTLSGIHYADRYLYMNTEILYSTEPYTDLSVPKTKGIRLILGEDIVSNAPRLGMQRIVFGDNLLNASLKYDFNNIATSLMVLGAEHEFEDGRKGRYNLFNTMDTATGETIYSYYIDANNGSIGKYGVIQKTVVDDNITSEGALSLWANLHRNALSNPVVEFSCTAIDLSTFDPNQDAFKLGDYAEVHFPGLDTHAEGFVYRCTGIKRNLLDPSKDEFTFSYSSETTLTSSNVFKTQSTTAGSPTIGGGGGSGGSGNIRSISVNKENIPPVNGNVDITVPVFKKTSQLDFQNIDNGYFTETIDGGVTTQFRTIQDSLGRITRITDQDGHSTEIIW